jgi:hypothetical protein
MGFAWMSVRNVPPKHPLKFFPKALWYGFITTAVECGEKRNPSFAVGTTLANVNQMWLTFHPKGNNRNEYRLGSSGAPVEAGDRDELGELSVWSHPENGSFTDLPGPIPSNDG